MAFQNIQTSSVISNGKSCTNRKNVFQLMLLAFKNVIFFVSSSGPDTSLYERSKKCQKNGNQKVITVRNFLRIFLYVHCYNFNVCEFQMSMLPEIRMEQPCQCSAH